jgi:hypothetical protein
VELPVPAVGEGAVAPRSTAADAFEQAPRRSTRPDRFGPPPRALDRRGWTGGRAPCSDSPPGW